MGKYDGEDLLDSILAVMTDGDALNLKIAAIEAEKTAAGKALDPVLKSIAAEAYFRQTWIDKVLQYNPAIFYGIEDVQATDGGGAVAKVYRIFVEIVLVDDGMQNDSSKRISRYSRALEELFLEVSRNEIPYAKIKVDSVRPIAFKLALDRDDEVKVGGVSLTIVLV